jgi:hypothetical protein
MANAGCRRDCRVPFTRVPTRGSLTELKEPYGALLRKRSNPDGSVEMGIRWRIGGVIKIPVWDCSPKHLETPPDWYLIKLWSHLYRLVQ